MAEYLIITNNSHLNSPRAYQILHSLRSKGIDAEYLETPLTKNQFKIGKYIFQKVKQEKPFIVHILNVFDFLYPPVVSLKGNAYKNLIYDVRVPWGVLLQSEFKIRMLRMFELFERYIARRADYITTANKLMAKKVLSYAPKKKSRIIILPNYPLRTFSNYKDHNVRRVKERFGNGKKVILYVGKISENEISPFFLRSIDNFKEENISFWFVGIGRRKLVNQLRKKKNVVMFGWKRREEVPNYVKACDVCVIPRSNNPLTAFLDEDDAWKLNEYIVYNKLIVATGINLSKEIPNLITGKPSDISELLRLVICQEPVFCEAKFWEDFCEPKIIQLYESLKINLNQ